MNIIIVGGGKVGEALCLSLSNEGHEVTLIDKNRSLIDSFSLVMDIRGVVGNGAVLETLSEADVETADIVIAVTPNDETNILSAIVAKRGGAKRTVARVRNPEYAKQFNQDETKIGIHYIINPELEAARAMLANIDFPFAVSIDRFMDGRELLVAMHVKEGRLTGRTLREIRARIPNFVLCGLLREEEQIPVRGDIVIEEGDTIFVLGAPRDVVTLAEELGHVHKSVRDILLIGGGILCRYFLPGLLERGIRVVVMELNEDRATALASDFPQIEVIQKDGTSHANLDEIGIENFDCVASLTNIDEENLLLSLYAHSVGVPMRISKVNRENLISLLPLDYIGSPISPKQIISEDITHYVRSLTAKEDQFTSVEGFAIVAGGRLEVVAFGVREDSNIAGKHIRDLRLRNNVVISMVRHGRDIVVPTGDTKLHVGDEVIVTVPTGLRPVDLDDILEVES